MRADFLVLTFLLVGFLFLFGDFRFSVLFLFLAGDFRVLGFWCRGPFFQGVLELVLGITAEDLVRATKLRIPSYSFWGLLMTTDSAGIAFFFFPMWLLLGLRCFVRVDSINTAM